MEHAVVECEERASLAVALDPRLGRDKSPEQARAGASVLGVPEAFYGRCSSHDNLQNRRKAPLSLGQSLHPWLSSNHKICGFGPEILCHFDGSATPTLEGCASVRSC